MKILVTGIRGQLGRCLADQACSNQAIDIDGYSSSELDITDLETLRSRLKASAPDYLINAAAYTAVDKAESEQEQAFAVNETGALNLAITCSELDIPLIHVSTDYVFLGTASSPYSETDRVEPSGVYGASKLAGEQAVADNCKKYVIVRTAWVFSEYGNNFVKTMLRLAGLNEEPGKELRDQLMVVSDQIGNPTYAGDIAKALIHICKSEGEHWGVYHYVGSSIASWFQFAQTIFEKAFATGLIQQQVKVKAITTSEYPTAAHRPAYSVLDTGKIERTFGIKPLSLDHSLTQVLDVLSAKSN